MSESGEGSISKREKNKLAQTKHREKRRIAAKANEELRRQLREKTEQVAKLTEELRRRDGGGQCCHCICQCKQQPQCNCAAAPEVPYSPPICGQFFDHDNTFSQHQYHCHHQLHVSTPYSANSCAQHMAMTPNFAVPQHGLSRSPSVSSTYLERSSSSITSFEEDYVPNFFLGFTESSGDIVTGATQLEHQQQPPDGAMIAYESEELADLVVPLELHPFQQPQSSNQVESEMDLITPRAHTM